MMRKELIFVIVLMFSAVVIADVNTSNCLSGSVGYWKLDAASGPVVDSYGPHNGTARGGVTRNVTGQVEKAFSFDGINDTVNISNHADLSINSSESLSISLWFKTNDTDVGNEGIIAKRVGASDHGACGHWEYQIFTRLGKVGGGVFNRFNNDLLGSFSSDVWTHVVLIWDASTQRVYAYNGAVLVSNLSITDGAWSNSFDGSSNNEPVVLGDLCSGGEFYDGLIDEVAVYDKVLTEDEVRTLYLHSLYNEDYCQVKVCGNGILEAGEECDDNNTATGDGCSDSCSLESFNTANCPSGLISYWTLDGHGKDMKDGNDGSVLAPFGASGQVGGAFEFDGDDYISVESASNLELNNKSKSVEAWFKTDTTSGIHMILRKSRDYDLSVRNGNLYWVYWNGDAFYENYFAFTDTSSWHHLVGTYNGSDAKMYLDGVEKNLTYNSGSHGVSSSVQIGRMVASGDFHYFDGLIDEVAVYDRALSASEVQQHYLDGNNNSGYCYSAFEEEVIPEVSNKTLQIFVILIVALLIGAALLHKN